MPVPVQVDGGDRLNERETRESLGRFERAIRPAAQQNEARRVARRAGRPQRHDRVLSPVAVEVSVGDLEWNVVELREDG